MAKALKTVRKARGLSQEASSDVSSRTYGKLPSRRDLKKPDLNKLAELCEGDGDHPAHAADTGLRGRQPAQDTDELLAQVRHWNRGGVD